jgi:2-dehydropantoate 2-reductase
MNACIYGAGAIGGFLGYHLARSGIDVSVVARGGTLAALKKNGLRFESKEESGSVPVRASDDPRDLGPQDLVVIAVKAYSLPAVSQTLTPLLAADTIVLPAMNGVPWWFFQGIGGKLEGTVLQSVDPGARSASAIPAESVVGCVVHIAASCPEPGFVAGGESKRLIIGEPSNKRTPRLESLAAALSGAGLAPEISTDIRTDLWYKLWGNLTMNPISALTCATMDRILADPLLERLCLDVMEEAREVGAAIGCPIAQGGPERLAIARAIGAFRTSMLQDLEAGKPLEIDALLGAVHEIATLVGKDTPNLDALLGLTTLLARTKGLVIKG